MRRNWPFFKDSDWLILVFVHSAKPTAELENLAMSPSLSSPGLSYDTKFVHIGLELRSSSVGDTILGVQSEPAYRHTAYDSACMLSFCQEISHVVGISPRGDTLSLFYYTVSCPGFAPSVLVRVILTFYLQFWYSYQQLL